MNNRSNIEKELVELNSALPANLEKPVFGLPEGYFENFAHSVLQKIKEEEALSPPDELSRLSSLLQSVSKKNPYSVPENYFASLSEDAAAIAAEDHLPSILKGASRSTPYDVPAGYFDGVADAVLKKVAPKEAKVIPMRSRWMRVAAAAMIAGIIAIGGFMYVNRSGTVMPDEQSVATQLQGISDSELDAFVSGAEVGSDEVDPTATGSEVNSLLSDVSTSEMDAFLAQLPTDDEELSIIN